MIQCSSKNQSFLNKTKTLLITNLILVTNYC